MKARVWIAAIILVIWACGWGAAAERTAWPGQIDVGLALSSRKDSRLQLMGEARGSVGQDLTLRAGGWVVNGQGNKAKGFLSNAYVGLDRPHFYAAAGQKFVVFGPAGLLVSPGARGGEVVLKGWPISLQLLGGRTQFTPPTGNAGRTTPNLEPILGQDRPRKEFFAARAEYDLAQGEKHQYLGLNALWVASKSGASVDLEVPAGGGKIFYAEVSTFDGTSAELGGMRLTDLGKYLHTSRETALDIFWRKVPEDYTPAVVGATQYYADREGLALGLYHRMSGLSAVGLYGDSRGVMVNFFRYFSLGPAK